MSESATATLERKEDSKGLDVYDEEVVAKWKPFMDNASSVVRDFIFERIKEKEEPPAYLDPNDPKKLEDAAKREVERKFKEMTKPEKLEIRKVDDLFKVDVILDNFMKHTDRAKKELGDDSVAKGDLLKEEDNWSEYGWTIPEKKRVRAELTEVLKGLNTGEDKEGQIDIIMELLLAKGVPTSKLINLKAAKAESDLSYNSLDPRTKKEYYKDSPEVFFVNSLGFTDNEIHHYIFGDLFYEKNEYDLYYTGRPKNIETLAWQIMHTSDEKYQGWGIKGDHPLLEMRIVKHEEDDPDGKYKKGDVDIEKSGYRVNTANMVHWARSLMYKQYDRDREDPHDYFAVISLQGRAALSFNEMLLSPKQFFASEDGTDYKGLMLEWYKEAAFFTTVRAWDVGYRLAQESPDELKKLFKSMYDTKCLLTRNALGANIMGLMTTMPLDYKGREKGKWESDSTLGAAWIDIYRCYDSMVDYENLRKILGNGSQFFNRKGWAQAMMEIAGDNMGVTGVSEMRVFMKKEAMEYFEDAFDANGEITTPKNRKNFVKFLNIFGERLIGGKHEWTVRAAVRNAIAEKYGKEVYVKDSKGKILVEEMSRERYEEVQKYCNCEFDDLGGGRVKVRYKKFAFVSESGKIGDKIKDRSENKISMLLAEAMAWSMVKPMGAGAKNDPDAVGHDWMGRPQHTELFRAKYTYKGDKKGNELTSPIFKATVMDLLNGIATESHTPVLDRQGNITYKMKDGKYLLDKKGQRVPIMRSKTPMEVFSELSELKTISAKAVREMERELEAIPDDNKAERASKIQEIRMFEQKANQVYQNRAQDMSFTQQTLAQYRLDHLEYGMDMYKYLVDNEEIEWEKFTSYDAFGGVRFKQAEFQKQVQTQLIHRIRYMFENFGSLNYNQTVRVMDQTATHNRHFKLKDEHGHGRGVEPVFKDVPLGEAMFGHEMLNRPIFWKRDARGKPINLRDKKGRKLRGLYEIDYQKVQDNKTQLWKQWVMTKIAADLYSHRALHQNDERFNFTYYENAIEALGRIPGDLDQDEYKFKQTHVKGYFFNKTDIAWLRKKAKATRFSLYGRAVFKDLLAMDDPKNEGIGLLAMLAIFTGQIIKSEAR